MMEDLLVGKKSPSEVSMVKEIINELLRARKIMRMYPENNPLYKQAYEKLFDKFKQFFTVHDELQLQIEKYSIIFDDEKVYHQDSKDDNLALLFFRDGVRMIIFQRGLAVEELKDFIKIINVDFDREMPDDDVVTLMWERGFQNIKYVIDESFFSEDGIPESEIDYAKAIKEAYKDALSSPKISPVIANDVHIPDSEWIYKEIQKHQRPKSHKLFRILIEMLKKVKDKDEIEKILRYMENIVDYYILHGDFKAAGDCIQIILTQSDEIKNSQDIEDYPEFIIRHINSDKLINNLGKVLESDINIEEESFMEFISFLDHTSIDYLMEELAQAEKIKARRLLINAISLIGSKEIQKIIKWLNDDRWYVVRNVAMILGNICDPLALKHLGRLISHPDRRVRKEAINAIGKIKSPESLRYLEQGLRDSEQPVRLATVRALISIKTEDARDMLLREISNRSFLRRDLNEKKEFFAALASWGDKEVREFLLKTLKKHSIFRRSKVEENKLCAAYALGLMDDRGAIPTLKKFQSSKNIYLKRISLEALKRLSA